MSSPLAVRDASGVLRVMPSVYSLAFPETNAAFDECRWPQHLFSVSATRAEFDEFLASVGLGALPEAGVKKLGLLDLVHEPVLDGIIDRLEPHVPGLSAIAAFRYPLHGSSAGIGMLMAHLRSDGCREVHVLEGDYEGFAAQAGHHGLEVCPVPLDEAAAMRGKVWFVSNPSACSGELLPPGFVDRLVASNRVVLDLAYHGLQGTQPVRVPEGTWAVLWSLSKPWGLFWRRVGMLACSEDIPGAFGTRWFKDPERLLAAYAVVQRFSPSAMADRYRWAQGVALDALRGAGLPAEAASTALLARVSRTDVSDGLWSEVAHCERVSGSGEARVCLTPLMEAAIRAC